MGFKISPFDAYARAEQMNDKFNRKNKKGTLELLKEFNFPLNERKN